MLRTTLKLSVLALILMQLSGSYSFEVKYLTKKEALRVILSDDTFMNDVSPFDIDVRLHANGKTKADYKAFLEKHTLGWNATVVKQYQKIVEKNRANIDKYFGAGVPAVIGLAQTTGDEENHAFYTRENQIMVPFSQDLGDDKWQKVFSHEVCHIFSRYNPVVRWKLYESLGFQRLPKPVPYPIPIEHLKITNPDTPVKMVDMAIKMTIEGKPSWFYPMTLANRPKYVGGNFFDYISILFLHVGDGETINSKGYNPNEPNIIPLAAPPIYKQFMAMVGPDIPEFFHPEELLCGYMGRLISGTTDGLKRPDLMNRVSKILLDNKPYKNTWKPDENLTVNESGKDGSMMNNKKMIVMGGAVAFVFVLVLGCFIYKKRQSCCYQALPEEEESQV